MRAVVRSEDAARAPSDLVVVRAQRLAALASAIEGAPRPTETELRAHDAITRRIHDTTPSLPSRFGQLFADESALASALKQREETLAASLASVGDRVELAITLAWRNPRAPDAAPAASGTEHLARAAAREGDRRTAERIVARLVEQLPIERAFVRHRSCPREGVAAIVTVLIARDEEVSMRSHIQSFGERSSEVAVTVHGPLPPYTFAS